MCAVMENNFEATRASGLSRLAAFAPHAGRDYSNNRNTDPGPGGGRTTSVLSPYLRRRLIVEHEAVAWADRAHGQQTAEKYVQEVFWRTYFKGHLETRPFLWTDYQRLAAEGHAQMRTNAGLRLAYEQATTGRTGIECLDDWALELTTENWLHNHTRMWFASIWIFTLRLPWALGADFFMRHLLDGDPASNTLSWRWVAGLHTRGKHYVARAENIRRYTDGRYNPAKLDEDPMPLDEPPVAGPVSIKPADKLPKGDAALLLHLDDLYPESLPLGSAKITRIGGLLAHADGAVERVRQFDRDAMADALSRASAHFGCEAALVAPGWSADLPVVAAYAPVGPSASALPKVAGVCRDWDTETWPHSKNGFFKVKTAIPRILARHPEWLSGD